MDGKKREIETKTDKFIEILAILQTFKTKFSKTIQQLLVLSSKESKTIALPLIGTDVDGPV